MTPDQGIGDTEVEVPVKAEARVPLPLYADEIRRSHFLARNCAALAVLCATQCGAYLIRARNTFLKEGFKQWAEKNCPFISLRTAYNYINLTEHVAARIQARLKASDMCVQPVAHSASGVQPVASLRLTLPGSKPQTTEPALLAEDSQAQDNPAKAEIDTATAVDPQATEQTADSDIEAQIVDWLINIKPPDPTNPQQATQDQLLTDFHEVTEGKALRQLYEQYGIIKPRKARRAKGAELNDIMPDPLHPNSEENDIFFAGRWVDQLRIHLEKLPFNDPYFTPEKRKEAIGLLGDALKIVSKLEWYTK